MIQPSHKFITPEEYLALEEKSRDKHEYWHGEIFMMAGTSRRHNRIVLNLARVLEDKVASRPCDVFAGDVRLRIDQDNAYTYPDVMVICGKTELDPRQQETVLNPTVIIEVLSESTQAYDHNEKFKMYRNIPSLEHYIMIDQTQPYIEAYRREGRFWMLETLEGLDAVLKLRALEIELTLSEIYARIDWSE